jgi:hypothetical protein
VLKGQDNAISYVRIWYIGGVMLMKKSYFFDSFSALAILLFSSFFQTFNVGYYSYGSFWGFAIGSIIVGLVRIKFNTKATFGSSLIGLIVILVISIGIVKIFPIKMRDMWDSVMPNINIGVNGVIYLLIINALSLFKIKHRTESVTKDY